MTGLEAMNELLKEHPDELFTTERIKDWLSEHAPGRNSKGIGLFVRNLTTNKRRKIRPEWGGKTYEEMGYNLLVEEKRNGQVLYRRYVKGVSPEPLVP